MLLIPRPNSGHPILIAFDCAKCKYFDKTHVQSDITIASALYLVSKYFTSCSGPNKIVIHDFTYLC